MKRLIILKEKIRIIFQVLRMNLRSSVITLLGLSIALSIITSYIIYLETDKPAYYLSLFEADRNNHIWYTHRIENISSFNESMLLDLKDAFDNKISEYGLNQLLVSCSLYPSYHLNYNMAFLNQSRNTNHDFYGLNHIESILYDCVAGSYLPTNPNETILIITSSSIVAQVGDSFNIMFGSGIEHGSYEYNHALQIAGIITPETLRDTSPLYDIFRGYPLKENECPFNVMILTGLDQSLKLFSEINTRIQALSSTSSIAVALEFRYDLQTSNITSNNVIQVVSSLKSFLEETSDHFMLNGVIMDRVTYTMYDILVGVKEYNEIFGYFLLVCIPALLTSILLGKFSLGVIHERRIKSFTLFHMRGFSRRFLLVTVQMECFILALIASLLSIILGIGGSIVISTTTGYLTFNLALLSNRYVVIPQFLLPLTFILSIGFTSLISFQSLTQLLNIDLIHLKQASFVSRLSKLRKFIGTKDLFLLSQGFLGMLLLVIIFQLINQSNLDVEQPQLFAFLFPVILVLLLGSPISFVIGFILTYNRVIPLIINKLGKYFWKRDWMVAATAARNLTVNKRIARQLGLLIACTLSFLMILSVSPLSFYQHTIDAFYYNTGTDIRLSVDRTEIEANRELTAQLESFEGIKFTTISYISFDVRTNDGTDYYSVYLLGIEENFHEVAHWRSYYDDQSIIDLVHSLFNSSASYPIIVDALTAQKESLAEASLYQPFKNEPDLITFSVVGITDCWPAATFPWRSRTWQTFITPRELLANISLITYEYQYTKFSTDRILIKVLPGYDSQIILSQLNEIAAKTGNVRSIDSVASQITEYAHSLQVKLLWISTNFNFFVCLFVVLFIIVLVLVNRIIHKASDLGLSRALGMKSSQIFNMLFLEPVLLFMVSGMPGGVVGLVFLLFLIGLYSPLIDYAPPFILNFNLPVIVFIFSIILIVTVLTGLLTSFLAVRSNISRVLKVD